MDISGKQRRTRRAIRGKSEFAGFDEIALFSEALTGAGLATDSSRQGSERLLMLRVLSAWARAVGPHLKTVAHPASCRQGRVLVDVRDVGWKRELERARPEILLRMSRLLPDHPIREITFRLKSDIHGGVSFRSPRLHALPNERETARTDADVKSAETRPVERDADTDLAAHWRLVMGRYLARSH